jgi:cytochrome c oxidase subunit 3/cytochrome o ubiquinol oxidase subunit 3
MATTTATPAQITEWKLPDRGTVGIISLIITESALFSIFVVAYLYYIGKSVIGPYPKDVLPLPIWATICLLSSSGTIVMAEHGLKHANLGKFKIWWAVTILLGLEFMHQTASEWHELITERHLTISTNLFGTCFYMLVGLHASHVIVGLTFMLIVFVVAMLGFPVHTQFRRIVFLSWYWHFVDVVWVVVFTVVYIIGR